MYFEWLQTLTSDRTFLGHQNHDLLASTLHNFNFEKKEIFCTQATRNVPKHFLLILIVGGGIGVRPKDDIDISLWLIPT